MTNEEATVITGAEQIEMARLLTLRSALKLEIRTGMKRSSRGRSTLSLVKDAVGGGSRSWTKRDAYAALNDKIVAALGSEFDRPL